jgi:hypothetical protein
MAKFEFNSAGVSAQEAGFVGPIRRQPVGIPAGIIGTSTKGPAFVPLTLGSMADFTTKFGDPNIFQNPSSDQERETTYGPLAVAEWMNNANAVTFVRVLGIGDGQRNIISGSNSGYVKNAGFTVGEEQPNYDLLSGAIGANPFANLGGMLGRTYFLGCFMSESNNSTIFSSAGLQGTGSVNGIGINTAVPIIRGILMAPSGVILRLSSSGGGYDSSAPQSSLVASDVTAHGTTLGSVRFVGKNSESIQQFVLLMNGHKGINNSPNFITASFDMQSPDYITRVLNMSASLIQEKGHYLAAYWDIHPSTAILTGVGIVTAGASAPDDSNRALNTERSAFIITSSLTRDTGSETVPNYEAFRDRFSHASTPWIISQKISGKNINLFKLHALDAGANVSNKYKIIVDNITPQPVGSNYKYGSFDITIRSIDDRELDATAPLESFQNVNLDPASTNYIAKLIGDIHAYFDFDRQIDNQKFVIEGNYPLMSNLVRVEVSDEVYNATLPAEAIPMGFRGISHLITSGSAPLAAIGGNDVAALLNPQFLRNTVTPPLPLVNNVIWNQPPILLIPKVRWGIKFDHTLNLLNENFNPPFNESINSFAKYFPNNSTINTNFSVVDDKTSQDKDTVELGIVNSDRFCNNIFSLERIKIVTGSNGFVFPISNWASAIYVRDGNISINAAEKTRPVNVNDLLDKPSQKFLSFQLMMQGGFDGVNIFEKNEYNITNAAARADMLDSARGKALGPNVIPYLKALEMLGNQTITNIQLLAIPGIREQIITDAAIATVEESFNAMYVMDIEQINNNGDSIEISTLPGGASQPSLASTMDLFSSRILNSSFAAAYFPDVLMKIDPQKYTVDSVMVPPSVVVMGALSLNDSIGYPWFAPAGVNRGALKSAIDVSIALKEADTDLLYSNDINPICKLSNIGGQQSSGIIIWGQKTLQRASSTLDRINVRRLLIEIRRQARDIALTLLFNPNRPDTLAQFSAQMNNKLSKIQSQLGLQSYKVIVDSSTTSQTDVENNTIRGLIYVQPPKTLEFVKLDFIVSNGLTPAI